MMPDTKITPSRDWGSGDFGVAKLHSCCHAACVSRGTQKPIHVIASASEAIHRAACGAMDCFVTTLVVTTLVAMTWR
jgi:hypothetical protein